MPEVKPNAAASAPAIPTQDSPLPNQLQEPESLTASDRAWLPATAQPAPASAQPTAQPTATPAARVDTGTPPITATSPNKHTHSFIARATSALFDAIVGTPGPTYSVDPASGKMIATPGPPQTTGQKLQRLAGNIGTALSAPTTPQKSGLANFLSGVGAGAGAVSEKQTAEDRARQQGAREDFEREQQTVLRKVEIAKANAATVQTMFHLHQAELDKNEFYNANKADVQWMEDLGVAVPRMNGAQLIKKYGETPQQLVSEHKILPIGERVVTDEQGREAVDPETGGPVWERLYAVPPGLDSEGQLGAKSLPKNAVDFINKYAKYAAQAPTGLDSFDENTPVTLHVGNLLFARAKEGYKAYLQGWAAPEPFETRDGQILERNPINGETRPASAERVQAYKIRQKQAGAITPIDVYKEQQANYRANLKAKQDQASAANTDVFGNTSPLAEKEFNKRYDAYNKSKQYQTLQTLTGSYQQFQQAVSDINSGKPLTGAASVVGLFNAIGISATPLAGKGFRITENTIQEHVSARGIDQAAYQKLLKLKNGDLITPQQLKDYASIAAGVYRDSFVNAANEQKRQLGYIDILPLGNNQPIDPMTAHLFLIVAGNDPAKARTAAQKSGWIVPQAQ